MAEKAKTDNGVTSSKKSKKPMFIGIIGAVVLGVGGFFAAYTGLILGPSSDSSHEEPVLAANLDEATFVELAPLTITLGKFATSRHLRFRAYLDVKPGTAEEIANLSPRILDVLNIYLRAVSEADLEDPTSMSRLRAQMLRRIQVVVGGGKVNDLLIAEFVLD